MEVDTERNNLGAMNKAVSAILSALEGLDNEAQARTLQAVATLLNTSLYGSVSGPNSNSDNLSRSTLSQPGFFTENRDISPKDFLREKSPKTDVERVACLAYYLTHYRQSPHFKTLDISTLNTEAAQAKFSNAAVAVENAVKSGVLVPAIKGTKQLSASGELFVQALPDRDAAKESMKGVRPRRKNKIRSSQKGI